MAMKLDKVVPLGRTLREYRAMFSLTDADLQAKILGCADGPASFNAELTAMGGSVTSIDPIYVMQPGEIQRAFDAVVDDIFTQVQTTRDDWVWDFHGSPDGLRAERERALACFLEDFAQPGASNRYVTASLPTLPLKDNAFDFVVCSHFLFLYSELLDEQMHLQSMAEMLRVGREVRVFPLLSLDLNPSPHVNAVIAWARDNGMQAELRRVDYEVQKGADTMLVVRR